MLIQVDTMQLIGKSNEIKKLNTDLQNILEQVEVLIRSLNEGWQGDAEQAFSEKIIYVKRQFKYIAKFFDDYAEMLKEFVYLYEQQETDLSSKINLT